MVIVGYPIRAAEEAQRKLQPNRQQTIHGLPQTPFALSISLHLF
jgi:hypothetical protein